LYKDEVEVNPQNRFGFIHKMLKSNPSSSKASPDFLTMLNDICPLFWELHQNSTDEAEDCVIVYPFVTGQSSGAQFDE